MFSIDKAEQIAVGSYQTEFFLSSPLVHNHRKTTRWLIKHHRSLYPSDPVLGSRKGAYTAQPFFLLLLQQAKPKEFLAFLSPCLYLPAHGPSIPYELAEWALAAFLCGGSCQQRLRP